MSLLSQCARCSVPRNRKVCVVRGGEGPKFCPTLRLKEVLDSVVEEYKKPEIREFARLASIQEAECYAGRKKDGYIIHPTKPRLQETIEFAKKIGAKRLGVAFCIGLQKEASLLHNVLEANGFEVVSVCCKVGRVPKETIGIKEEEKIRIGSFEAMCNPIMQAEVMNYQKTDLNILFGLCVGHDSLFLKKSKALCTVLVVKDRVTGHNPISSLYTIHSYSQRFLYPGSF